MRLVVVVVAGGEVLWMIRGVGRLGRLWVWRYVGLFSSGFFEGEDGFCESR